MNNEDTIKEELLTQHKVIWDTKSLQEDYKVIGFFAPFVVVERKSDNKKGTLEFTHSPRFYFNFIED